MAASPYRGRLGASLACGEDVTSGGISRPAAWHAAWQLGKWAMPTWVSLTFLVAHNWTPSRPPWREKPQSSGSFLRSNDPSASFTIRP